MTDAQLTEEFIKEINTGYRSRKLQHIIDNLAEEAIGAAYLEAIDKIQRQKERLTERNIKEFLTPIDDFYDEEQVADAQFQTLTSMLNINSQKVFFVRVDGESMKNANIHNNDILIASKTTTAAPDTIVIAQVGETFYIKRYKIIDEKVWLYSENEAFKPVEIKKEMDFEIVGIVKNVIKSVK